MSEKGMNIWKKSAVIVSSFVYENAFVFVQTCTSEETVLCSAAQLEYWESTQADTDLILNDRTTVSDTAILLSNVMQCTSGCKMRSTKPKSYFIKRYAIYVLYMWKMNEKYSAFLPGFEEEVCN